MKKNSTKNNSSPMESGDQELALLIKEAGKTARERKKKAMAAHFKKIKLAVIGKLSVSDVG